LKKGAQVALIATHGGIRDGTLACAARQRQASRPAVEPLQARSCVDPAFAIAGQIVCPSIWTTGPQDDSPSALVGTSARFDGDSMQKTLLTLMAGAAALVLATAALAELQGPRLGGEFDVFWVNCTDSNTARSQATYKSYRAEAARADQQSGTPPEDDKLRTCNTGWLVYEGPLDFQSTVPNGETTIFEWFASSGGAITAGGVPPLLLSKPPLASDPDTATTTFILFISNAQLPPSNLAIRHNDGVELLVSDGDVSSPEVLQSQGNTVGSAEIRETFISSHKGGRLWVVYVATNGDPSVLTVVAEPQ
jgi:hypothetical protein